LKQDFRLSQICTPREPISEGEAKITKESVIEQPSGVLVSWNPATEISCSINLDLKNEALDPKSASDSSPHSFLFRGSLMDKQLYDTTRNSTTELVGNLDARLEPHEVMVEGAK